MDEGLMRRRVAEARVGRLATIRAHGRPHVVPCCFILKGEVIYTAVDDVKPKGTRDLVRLDNVRRNPAASLLVDEYVEDWSALWWIRLDGQARVVMPPSAEQREASELLAGKYDQYALAPPPGPVLAIEVGVWRAWP